MQNLENYGVQEMNAKEIREIDGGWIVPVLRGIAYALSIYASVNDECNNCLNNRISAGLAASDGSLGGSRPFE